MRQRRILPRQQITMERIAADEQPLLRLAAGSACGVLAAAIGSRGRERVDCWSQPSGLDELFTA